MQKLLDRKNRIVATTRVPAQAAALQQLSKEHPDQLHVTALDTDKPESIAAWAQQLKETGPGHVDVSAFAHRALHMHADQKRAARILRWIAWRPATLS